MRDTVEDMSDNLTLTLYKDAVLKGATTRFESDLRHTPDHTQESVKVFHQRLCELIAVHHADFYRLHSAIRDNVLELLDQAKTALETQQSPLKSTYEALHAIRDLNSEMKRVFPMALVA